MADALFGSIVLNEVMPDPNSATGATGPRFDTDGSGSTTPVDEFIEIYNSGPTAVNIGGLQLWDERWATGSPFRPARFCNLAVMPWSWSGRRAAPARRLAPMIWPFMPGAARPC